MSALGGLAGIAKGVAGALPFVGTLAKGAWNLGKKVVGGIKGLFSGGGSEMADSANQAFQYAKNLWNQGGDIYDSFRNGGFRGGMDAIQRNIPDMRQSFNDMANAGRDFYNQGQNMYNRGRDMYNSYSGEARGLYNQGRDMFRQRRRLQYSGAF